MTEYIEIDDEKYPDSLRKISKAPKRLYYKGNIDLLNSNCFAVVGSRDLTTYGEYIEKRFVKSLTLSGATIVSRNGGWSRWCST